MLFCGIDKTSRSDRKGLSTGPADIREEGCCTVSFHDDAIGFGIRGRPLVLRHVRLAYGLQPRYAGSPLFPHRSFFAVVINYTVRYRTRRKVEYEVNGISLLTLGVPGRLGCLAIGLLVAHVGLWTSASISEHQRDSIGPKAAVGLQR